MDLSFYFFYIFRYFVKILKYLFLTFLAILLLRNRVEVRKFHFSTDDAP